MMGGAKSSAAVSAASTTGSRRVAGTIAEAAAIARRAAEDRQSAPVSAPASPPPNDEQERHGAPSPESSKAALDQDSVSDGSPPADPVLMRRSRAGAGQLKDASQGPDSGAVHLILAGRAYAYGKSIVHPDEGKKPGDSVAIES
jgi:hypothetical protein